MIFEINLDLLSDDESLMFWNWIETGKCKPFTPPTKSTNETPMTMDQYRTLIETVDAYNIWRSTQ